MTMQLGANWYRTRAHYSDALVTRRSVGSEGPSLCSTENFPVTVFDAEAHAAIEETYGLTPKTIESLPLCKKCVRRMAKLDGAA